METFPLDFILMYILLPAIALITGVGAYYLNKKFNLFSKKKSIWILVCSVFIMGSPGILGLVDYWFMPYIYICLAVFYLLLGLYNLALINSLYAEIKNQGFGYEYTLFCIQMILGIGVFSLIFNLTNELKYGIWASTCILPYIFISLYKQAYHSLINIPLEIYKVWQYSPDKRIFPDKTRKCNEVIRIELCKKAEDSIAHRIIVQFYGDQIFWEWFQLMLEDYNFAHPGEEIEYFKNEESFGWIFYYKPSFFVPRKYIDPDLTIFHNGLHRHHVIIAERVRKES